MKKTIAAAVAGLLLVAGQAVAAGQASTPRVGDRLGATAGTSSEFAGIPVVALIAGLGILAATIVVVSDDDSESD